MLRTDDNSVRNVGEVRGRDLERWQRPLPSKKEILLYILYRVPRYVNARPESLGRLEKLFFHFPFFRVCAYLPTGFAIYRMVLDHIILLTVLLQGYSTVNI